MARHDEIMASVETQFAPMRMALQNEHIQKLGEARFKARQTHNAGAMLPAEAECYIAHARATVVAHANCMAAAYDAFGEPAGADARAELAKFFVQAVGGRKSAFQGEMQKRQLRTRTAFPQAPSLLEGFEREANVALLEGRAILDKQRVAMQNKPAHSAVATKYVVETCVFNWLADGLIRKEALPSDGGFAITHVQVEEISATKDEGRRICLWLVQTDLHCKLLPTQTFIWDISRWDYAKWGGGQLFTALKQELDILNKGKANNTRDALIAETAIASGLTLITADGHLKLAAEKHGGTVLFFPSPTSGKNS